MNEETFSVVTLSKVSPESFGFQFKQSDLKVKCGRSETLTLSFDLARLVVVSVAASSFFCF